MYRAILTLISVVFLATQAVAGDPVVVFENEDKEMNAAIAQARSTLPEFLTLVASGNPEIENFGVKVSLQGDEYIEHIWVSDVTVLGEGKFRGQLANAPVNLGRMKLGDRITFYNRQISDWNFVRDGKAYGYFTVRVIARQMAEDDAAALAGFLSAKPLPVKW
ncbi:MAG: DUF2314 domain-containing protein [Rhodobacteraceae bacterium]|nr:DUF2314 domain-containing protein [Paracoccaceae bacterium]